MKKQIIILSALSSILLAGAAAFVLAKKNVLGYSRVRADDNKSITWTKDTGATATTSSGNTITLSDRYSTEWTFGGDYFASSTSGNSFIDNFEHGDSPFQAIKAFTVNYTYTGSPLFFSMFLTGDYYYSSTCARITEVQSGKKYEVGVDEFDYINTTSSSTFRYFYLNNPAGSTANITSLTIEYTCS